MLIENENTYISINDANEYIESNYADYAPLAVHWSVLTDKEKSGYLLASMREIDNLPYVGQKVDINQKLAFPRRNIRIGAYYYPKYLFPYSSSEIPNDVKSAQIENALSILQKEINAITDRQFMTLQSLGVVKNTKYNKREAGDIGFSDELRGGSERSVPISSAKAYSLLKRYLGGGFRC